MSTPYERPTDELRQVQHRSLLWDGDWYTFFVVQRKWLVQYGEPREVPYYQYLASDEAEWPLPSAVCTVTLPMSGIWTALGGCTSSTVSQSLTKSVVKLKEEWRDLPVVEAKDL